MKRFEKYYGWIAAFIFCVAVIAVYKTFDNISNITKYIATVFGALKPFFAAFVIAYILNMPAKRLQNVIKRSKYKNISEHSLGISIVIIYLISIIIVVMVLRMLIPALYRNIMDLYDNLPEYINDFQNYINSFEISKKLQLSERGIDLYKEISKIFTSTDMTQFGKYAQGVYNVTTGLFDVFVAVVASIYMLIDKERLQKGIVRGISLVVKEQRTQSIIKHAKRVNEIFTNYLYSRLMCSIIMAIVCSIALMVLKVRYALVLGIFIGMMDMIPYFGSIISSAIGIVITFITGGLWKGIWTAVTLIVLQQIDGNLLGPKIMGDSLEMRPLWIIFAVSVGGTLFGFLGMLFSVPVLAIVRAVFAEYVENKEKVISKDGETDG